jgi:hypothetical protein
MTEIGYYNPTTERGMGSALFGYPLYEVVQKEPKSNGNFVMTFTHRGICSTPEDAKAWCDGDNAILDAKNADGKPKVYSVYPLEKTK